LGWAAGAAGWFCWAAGWFAGGWPLRSWAAGVNESVLKGTPRPVAGVVLGAEEGRSSAAGAEVEGDEAGGALSLAAGVKLSVGAAGAAGAASADVDESAGAEASGVGVSSAAGSGAEGGGALETSGKSMTIPFRGGAFICRAPAPDGGAGGTAVRPTLG